MAVKPCIQPCMSSLCISLYFNPLMSHSWLQSWLLCITTLEFSGVKYRRWHGDFPGICLSSRSISQEGSCAKTLNSSYLQGFSPENSKQPPKLTHMAWVTHTVACLSDRWSLQREMPWLDALHRPAATYKVHFVCPKPHSPDAIRCSKCVCVVFYTYEWWLKGYRWKWDLSL